MEAAVNEEKSLRRMAKAVRHHGHLNRAWAMVTLSFIRDDMKIMRETFANIL